MNRNSLYRLLIFIPAVGAAIFSWFYTRNLADTLQEEERKRIELWVAAIDETRNTDFDDDVSNVVTMILQENTTIPVVLCQDGSRYQAKNIDTNGKDEKFYQHLTAKMSKQHPPMTLQYGEEGHTDFIYYQDSIPLSKLEYYPLWQAVVALLLIIAAYLALRSAGKAEENAMLVGLSKETAHQLGTPISSLLAFVEILKIDYTDQKLINEVEKDVNRLTIITERFSRIGSTPELIYAPLKPAIENAVNYLKSRVSRNVDFDLYLDPDARINYNASLIEWVIENICKNGVDAMQGKGKITISMFCQQKKVCIEITDTGKGIIKRNYKKVFIAGFTTKKHGWGLGLSLAEGIIKRYHKGEIYIKNSELNIGTTFRIEMPIKS